MFNILNPDTYNEATNEEFVFNDIKIYNTRNGCYFNNKDIIAMIRNMEIINKKDNPNFKLSSNNIQDFIIRMKNTYDELKKQHEEYINDFE